MNERYAIQTRHFRKPAQLHHKKIGTKLFWMTNRVMTTSFWMNKVEHFSVFNGAGGIFLKSLLTFTTPLG